MRRSFLKLVTVGFAGVMAGAAYAQAPAFGDVAGKWEATGPNGKIELAIEPTGAFSFAAPRGTESGVAKMEGGQIVMAFTKNPGNVKLSKAGDALQGTAVLGVNTIPLTFNRKK